MQIYIFVNIPKDMKVEWQPISFIKFIISVLMGAIAIIIMNNFAYFIFL